MDRIVYRVEIDGETEVVFDYMCYGYRAVPGPFESTQQHRETIKWRKAPTKARHTLSNYVVSGLTVYVM